MLKTALKYWGWVSVLNAVSRMLQIAETIGNPFLFTLSSFYCITILYFHSHQVSIEAISKIINFIPHQIILKHHNVIMQEIQNARLYAVFEITQNTILKKVY